MKRGSSKTRLAAMEKEIKGRGVSLAYERLQYAGLMLRGGLCWFRGRYYLFVDRRKTVSDRLELLGAALEELDRLAAEGRLDSPLPRPEDGEDALAEDAPDRAADETGEGNG